LNGNETASWADARLTSLGITQAQTAHTFWQSELTMQNIHPPDSYFVSPLFRALMTAKITFDGLRFPPGAAPFQPLILEVFRETISIHTCDRRSSRTEIHDAFPSWQIESSFTECDELWNGVTAETGAAEEVRARRALDRVFASRQDRGLFISITSHSGEIAAVLQVLGHRPFDLNTGAVIPVLVKAETISVEPTETTAPQWTTSAHCISPPVTSVSTGCLCASSAAPVTTPLVAPNMCS
jgi:broad specificity phosphatase PhoE